MSKSSDNTTTSEVDDSVQRRHRDLFESIDTAHQGKITLKDFERAFEETGHPLKNSKYAIHEIYHAFNTSNSKNVPIDINDNDNSNNKKNKDNNTSTMSTKEYVDFEKFNKYLVTAESQIQEGFKNVDKDHDGRILKRDFKDYLQKTQNITASPEEIDIFFKKLDTNNSGYVTLEEFRDALLFMPRMNGSRIQTAFKYFNDNLENMSSEGDFTVSDDILKSVGFFLAGGISGVVSRTCTAPFDRVKVFLIARTDLSSTLLHSKDQLQKEIEEKKHGHISKKKIQSPLIRAARTLYKQGGFKAFYVGNGLNVLKVFPESAMKFGSFEAAKRFMCQLENVPDDSKLSKFSTYVAGGIGGVLAQMTVYPIDTLKYRIQCANLDSGISGNKLLFKTAKEMYKEGGLRLFYRGLFVGIAGMFPYAALDLGTFTTVKKWYFEKEAQKQQIPVDQVTLPNYVVLTMGAMSGTFGATVVYPVNLLRTRLQAQGTFAHPYTYNGFIDVARKTVQREGIPGLFKGLLPNLAKVAPAVSISYLLYENLKVMFHLEQDRR